MATIYNGDLTREIIDGAKLQVSKDVVPNQIAEKVVPVMEVNPFLLRKINVVRFTDASGTIYTTPANKDFYFYGGSMAVGGGTADNSITIVPKGQLITDFLTAITQVSALITASNVAVTSILPIPILLQRSSVIGFQMNSTLGQAVIYGVEVEV